MLVPEQKRGPAETRLSCVPGLPKAACVAHLKAVVSMTFFQMCGATSQDVVYITLPLYHMSGSLLGIGGCIHLGETSALTWLVSKPGVSPVGCSWIRSDISWKSLLPPPCGDLPTLTALRSSFT